MPSSATASDRDGRIASMVTMLGLDGERHSVVAYDLTDRTEPNRTEPNESFSRSLQGIRAVREHRIEPNRTISNCIEPNRTVLQHVNPNRIESNRPSHDVGDSERMRDLRHISPTPLSRA